MTLNYRKDIPESSHLEGLQAGLDIRRAILELDDLPIIGFCPELDQRRSEDVKYRTMSDGVNQFDADDEITRKAKGTDLKEV
jgi:hypothetical protein